MKQILSMEDETSKLIVQEGMSYGVPIMVVVGTDKTTGIEVRMVKRLRTEETKCQI